MRSEPDRTTAPERRTLANPRRLRASMPAGSPALARRPGEPAPDAQGERSA